ncbi:MAG: hypothetical protein PHW07_05390 [Sulfurospirillaceae bacterium]|nr:hypothetical protein [Sulfurospirillaceae bacterium]
MIKIFTKNKQYSLEEIIYICNKYDLITVDCLKDENMISVEAYNDGALGDCIFEFKRVDDDIFKLSYVDKEELQVFYENCPKIQNITKENHCILNPIHLKN